ncbi:unnamed protein product [Closterium sp. Yama58-4]|nr:unnamed protein product [Closterium sp. Yama58-4]
MGGAAVVEPARRVPLLGNRNKRKARAAAAGDYKPNLERPVDESEEREVVILPASFSRELARPPLLRPPEVAGSIPFDATVARGNGGMAEGAGGSAGGCRLMYGVVGGEMVSAEEGAGGGSAQWGAGGGDEAEGGEGGEHESTAAKKLQKADREKMRRDRLNDQFMELASVLDPDRPKNDKATILSDGLTMLRELRANVNRLRAEHSALVDESKELAAEKSELRQEKGALKGEVDALKGQLHHRMSALLPWATAPPSATAPAAATAHPSATAPPATPAAPAPTASAAPPPAVRVPAAAPIPAGAPSGAAPPSRPPFAAPAPASAPAPSATPASSPPPAVADAASAPSMQFHPQFRPQMLTSPLHMQQGVQAMSQPGMLTHLQQLPGQGSSAGGGGGPAERGSGGGGGGSAAAGESAGGAGGAGGAGSAAGAGSMPHWLWAASHRPA